MESSRRKEKLRKLGKFVCSKVCIMDNNVKDCKSCDVYLLINSLLKEC